MYPRSTTNGLPATQIILYNRYTQALGIVIIVNRNMLNVLMIQSHKLLCMNLTILALKAAEINAYKKFADIPVLKLVGIA